MTAVSRWRWIPLIAALTTAFLALPVFAQDDAASMARAEIAAQIDELGTTLKAAVMSGVMSDAEAMEVYARVAKASKVAYVLEFEGGTQLGDGGKKASAEPSAKANAAQLFPASPEQPRELLRPEFLRRDVPVLVEALGFDDGQRRIVDIVFEEYASSYALASAPLREALTQYRSAQMNRLIAHALEDAGVRLDDAVSRARQAGQEVAQARLRETLDRIDAEKDVDSDSDRQAYNDWKQSMMDATQDLDARLAELRDRARARLERLDDDTSMITADTLLSLATQLRLDRAQLREDLKESIALIANDAQRGDSDGTINTAFASMHVQSQLPRGRFGGESINLGRAVVQTTPMDPDIASFLLDMVRNRTALISRWIDTRVNATLDREIAGLELQSIRDRLAERDDVSVFALDEQHLAAAYAPYSRALRDEIDARTSLRDGLLQLMEEMATAVADAYPNADADVAFRTAALRRGFSVEMRTRWTEQAISAALTIGDLDDEARRAIESLVDAAAAELRSLRAQAIVQRITRDPITARALVQSQFGFKKVQFDDDMWMEPMSAAFNALDDQTEDLLRSLLTPEQFAMLPSRPRTWQDWDAIKKKEAAAQKSAADKKAAGGKGGGKKRP